MSGRLLVLLLVTGVESVFGSAHALAAVPQQSSPEPLRIQLGGKPSRGRWVEVTPLVYGLAPRIARASDESESLELVGLRPGPTVFCVGAEGMATRCERLVLEGQKALALTPAAEGVQLVGRALVGRAPAAAARISVVPHPLNARRPFSIPLFWRDRKLVREVACDDGGRFAVPLLAPGAYRLDILRSGGRIDQTASFTVPEARTLRTKGSPVQVPVFDLGDLVLDDGLELEVTVVDTSGQPLAGAGVGIIQERQSALPIFIEARTDVAGKAVLTGLDSALPVLLSCSAPGRVRTEQRLDPLPALANCALSEFSSIEGIVLDLDDSPIEAATMSLKSRAEPVRTDGRGRFALRHLAEGEYRLTVAAPGFRGFRQTLSLGVEERRELSPIRLVPAEAIEGWVVDGTSRQPIAGASVTVVDPPGGGAAVTDEEGRFRLAADGAGLVLETSGEGYPPVATEVPHRRPKADEPLTIELRPGGRISVSVWDESQDAPCGGCSISVTQPGGRTHGLRLSTDGNGEALSSLLAAGKYHVALESVQSVGPVVHVQGGDQLRMADVDPGRISHVQFGEPRLTVEVAFWPPPAAQWMLEASGGGAVQLSRTGPNGVYLVKRKAGEETTLSLCSPSGVRVAQATLAVDSEDPAIQLALPQTSVQGALVLQGEPVSGQPIALMSMASGLTAARAQTDSTGSFQIPYLRPGVYRLLLGGHALRTFEMTPGAAVDLGAITAFSGPLDSSPP